MNPVVSLKRPCPVDFSLCIICQTGGGSLRHASKQGIETLTNTTEIRRKLRDTKNRSAIDRLVDVLDSEHASSLVWHKNCYSQFSDKNKIKRLESTQDSHPVKDDMASSSNRAHSPQPCSSRRSSVTPMNWNLCMFCQNIHPKERLCSVMTFNTSSDILDAAKMDYNLCLRLAGVSDLIAAEAKYHLTCFSSFKRTTSKIKHDSKHTDLAMIWLCNELQYAAEKGHVLKLSDVWDRYVKLTQDANTAIPKSFVSRRTTFRDKVQSRVGDNILFVQPPGGPSERETLLLPSKYTGVAISKLASASDEMLPIPSYEPEDNIYLSLVHVALKLRGDLMAKPGHTGFGVNEENAMECIPDSLYMFLQLLYGGSCQLEGEVCADEQVRLKQRVLSTGQDIIYGVSGGQKWTPKHIGLASTLHQVTRSRDLVQLFHNAGHTLSYQQVMQMDTALAESTLQSMDLNTGSVIPPNLVPNKFVHYTADNIDILDETLDGKHTFHATQVAAWQRGPAPDVMLDTMTPSTKRILEVPEAMENLCPANMPAAKASPVFQVPVEKAWYDQPGGDLHAKDAEAADLAFNMMRQKSTIKTSWTVFNESISAENPAKTTIGYMPIIQSPAHEYDTLNTVVQRCMKVSSHLGQEYTVITVDQALYGKLMELKWCKPEYHNKLIPRLGGLHTSMNFLKAIGQHMEGSGLAEAWVEAGIIGQNTAVQVMAGKAYNKAMRSHKITLQALWHILGPDILKFVETADKQLFDDVSQAVLDSSDAKTLISLLSNPRFGKIMVTFLEQRAQDNVNFTYWWGYMEMVSILLNFTRAQRDGIWDLHLHSFICMLPFFLRYDHYNYGRWGPVYVAEMKMLPVQVLTEFQQGNFVVKRSPRKFNQVDPDQAQEWINGTGKKGGGIVGITKTTSALSRWALSYNLRSHISADTHEMFHIYLGDSANHNEAMPGRQQRDNADEQSLLTVFQRFQVFASDMHPTVLQNIATKDLATEKIQESLLNARKLGQQQLEAFVNDRLLAQPGISAGQSIYDPIKKNNAPTFETLYEVMTLSEKNKNTVLKADRTVLQRLVTSYAAGRNVDINSIVKHELMPVPVALAQMNGSLRTGNKSMLADILILDIECPATINLHGKSACLLIDGQARVVSIGKPASAKTFGELADVFTTSILQSGSAYHRIDVVFDRYRGESIKADTRQRRAKTTRPIRRVIEGRDVPLPNSWANFITLSENKADLAQFLSEELLANAPCDKEIVVSGGFEEEEEVRSSHAASNLTALRATHEEADTRLILHAINVHMDTVVVSARDTDILLLLVSHFARVNCNHLWMMSGTAKKRKYVPIDAVYQKLPSGSINALLPFHALTGCDTTSYIYGHTKQSAWKVFIVHHKLLGDLGEGDLTHSKLRSAEKFVCIMYGKDHTDSVDSLRSIMFSKSGKPEKLPPTSDSLLLHIKRVHYQSMVWKKAHCADPQLPDACEMGWKRDDTGLKPKLMTLDSIPEACLEIVSCSCRTRCQTLRCKCRKMKLPCTSACECRQLADDCFNTRGS